MVFIILISAKCFKPICIMNFYELL
ncbi:unnamed protein product [Spirodela intermedia]|uniref:Uncharacterized protein n=1 Tax=Spirodela intermedia TaxID=51605 RepID=A0A7I8ITD5_SPIIN|nr:unnamed protein product [Spirodela intermedia]CAA6661055.1 unnamed protein product [Spirodela intermedia]